jgi:hypothetical protein
MAIGGGSATMLVNSDLTLFGSMTVASDTSGVFRVRRTSTANTYHVYRIS